MSSSSLRWRRPLALCGLAVLALSACTSTPTTLPKADRDAVEKVVAQSVVAMQQMDRVTFNKLQCQGKQVVGGDDKSPVDALVSHIRLRELRNVRRVTDTSATAELVVYYENQKDHPDRVEMVALRKEGGAWLMC